MQQRKVTFPVSRSLRAATEIACWYHTLTGPSHCTGIWMLFPRRWQLTWSRNNTAGKVSRFPWIVLLRCSRYKKANRLEKQAIRAIRAVPTCILRSATRTHFMTMAWLQPTCSIMASISWKMRCRPNSGWSFFMDTALLTTAYLSPVSLPVLTETINRRQSMFRTPSLWR